VTIREAPWMTPFLFCMTSGLGWLQWREEAASLQPEKLFTTVSGCWRESLAHASRRQKRRREERNTLAMAIFYDEAYWLNTSSGWRREEAPKKYYNLGIWKRQKHYKRLAAHPSIPAWQNTGWRREGSAEKHRRRRQLRRQLASFWRLVNWRGGWLAA